MAITPKQKIKIRLMVYKIMLPIYIAIAGMLLSFYCERVINNSLVYDRYCWIIWAISGAVITLLLNNYDKKLILFLFFSYSYGAFFFAALCFVNSNFGSNNSRQIDLLILERSANGRYPYVTVNLDNHKKDISINVDDRDRIDKANDIILTFNRGLFGIDVIEDKKLH